MSGLRKVLLECVQLFFLFIITKAGFFFSNLVRIWIWIDDFMLKKKLHKDLPIIYFAII